ncbi:Apoptotic ATPase [Handroanthus impetiginosus]|uniref:Apoptotic ATPase n=1 Tax=Handroanthus impetiginosus TaxID=429701 RepID=A0A2G9GQN4_9LAMI|nr:Apoptotic ATPase [Handroanthus impetiginosus]
MADAVASAVINKVDILATKLMEESSRLYWLREDVEWLKRQMRHMQGYLENAEAKKIANPNVVNLIKDIRDLVHDVEDILDFYLPQIESHRSSGLLKRMSTCFLPYGWTFSEFSREIEKIRRRVDSIAEDRKVYGIEDISRTEDVSNVDPRTTRLHVDDPIIVGFKQDSKILKSKLKNHPFVSVVGMAGVGKTTLAKKVFKDIKDDFDCCASVSVSQKPNIKDLVQDIANQVDLPKEKQEEKLEVNLYFLLQGKRYVVFLDDIWDIKAWDSLKACFPISFESASRIIITSRYRSVGRSIGVENYLHNWRFSKLIMPTNKKFDSKLEDIGRKIVKKCGGVPLAIVVIVDMLRERGMSEFSWNGVLHSLGENASDLCSQILGLSYKDLPTFLKPCFLCFGNFPEDYEFSTSQVIRLWTTEKFIPRTGGDWEPEDVGADYISKLEARNLILVVTRGRHEHDGRVKKFRIHGLLHSLCVNMGREINFLDTIDHLESSSATRVRRLCVQNHSFIENEKLISQMTKLQTLLFKLLQVLKLVFLLEDVQIPFQIENLSRLNDLEIFSSKWVEIPSSIRGLKNLQTLDFRGCGFVRLLCQYQQVQVLLPKLQTLAAIHCSDLKPSWLLKFTNLRKLVLANVTPKIMEVLCEPEPISKKLESLCCWGFDCSMNRRASLAKYERLKKLKLRSVEMQQLPELPPSLIRLTLAWTKLIEDPMTTLKNLPKLEILRMRRDAYLGKELTEGEEMAMSKLRQLIMESCVMLVRIPERLQELWIKIKITG